MKPLLGQLQNAAGLDELMSSPKAVGGNFDRAGSNHKTASSKQAGDSSFSEMLLSTLQKTQQNRPAQKAETPAQKAQANMPKQAFAEKVANNDQRSAASRTPVVKEISKPVRDVDAVERSDKANSSTGPAAFASSPRPTKAAPEKSENAEQPLSTSAIQSVAAQTQTASTSQGVPNAASMTPEQLAALAMTNGAMQQASADQLAAAASVVNGDAKAALAPLKGLMTGKPAADALINRNPVLAFVTGHLEKLDPESLPALITDSALIKQAMSANDVAQFMQTPMTIGDLVSLLELDQSLVNKASQAGLDPNKLVTPKEFLQALGLDAGRVASELSILKQKLPSEGVASYVQRAKAMMANAAKVVGQSPVANTASKLNKDASNEIATGKKSAGDAKERMTSELGSPTLANIAVPSSDAGVNVQAANLAGMVQANAANLSSSNDSLVQQNVGLAGSMSAMSKTVLSQTSKQPLANESVDPADLLAAQAIYSGVKIASTSDNLKSDNIATTSAILDASKLEITEDAPAFDLRSVEQISSNEIAKDPYSELGRIMDTNSMTKVDFGGDGMSQRSLEEHLLSRGIQQALQQKTDPTGEGKGLDLRLKDEPGEILNIDMLQDVKPNMLADTQVVITPSKESSMTGFDFSQGEGFQDGSAAFREQTTEFATSLGKQTTEIRQTSDLFADKISEAPKGTTKESLASKILGHAQMMLKNGGGSMRLDVEAPGIGKVDVAINLNNNQLDVRIITASEQARDMISKEVLGLRDGLTQQGINLRGLEVGKAGESSPRNFAGQGQQFGQGAQDQRASYNDMREYAQSFKNNFAPRADRAMTQVASTLSRWSNASIPSNGNGRLEVRV